MHEDPDLAVPTLLGNDATVAQVDPWLFLFSFSLTSLIAVAVGRAGSPLPPCLRYKYKLSWHVWLSWYLYCCAGNTQVKVRHNGGAL